MGRLVGAVSMENTNRFYRACSSRITFCAFQPFGALMTSNSTTSPSSSFLCFEFERTEVKCTKTVRSCVPCRSPMVQRCSRAVVAIGSDRLAFNVSALTAARTALPLPRPLRGKLASAGATCTQPALTVSRLSHASPHALREEMTHLPPLYVLS